MNDGPGVGVGGYDSRSGVVVCEGRGGGAGGL